MPILKNLKYIIYLKKKKTNKHNNNNNEKLRPDRMGPNRLRLDRIEINVQYIIIKQFHNSYK